MLDRPNWLGYMAWRCIPAPPSRQRARCVRVRPADAAEHEPPSCRTRANRRPRQTAIVVIIGELAILRGTHDQLHARWNTDELLVDVELTIAEHDQLCRAAEPIAGDRRRLDPAYGFLLLDRPVPPCRHRLGRPGPDARVHDTQQGLVLGIDRHHRMAEKARRLTVAGRSQSFARAITILEIDLRGILRRHDPPSRTGGRGSLSRSDEDFLMRDISPRRSLPTCRNTRDPVSTTRSHSAAPALCRRASPK